MSKMFDVQNLAVSSSVGRELLMANFPTKEKIFSPKMDFMGISRSETLSGVERTSSRRSWLHSSRNMHQTLGSIPLY
ncbi:hypothetical protein T03_146 [Trichinella britovi]|uniref:Uncharacterized protein n=1 Tax=Trichinella britovi TaxID=45882 RepID=A0A0V1CWK4_TRIBR|nr:hypothetical protein T03_146 [Trichinella britovi]